MKTRLVLPLLGATVLAVVVLGVVLWPAPSVSPLLEEPRSPTAAEAPGTPAPREPQLPPRQPPRAAAPEHSASTPAPEAPGRATVVPVGPEDEVPSPESPNPLPQVNDPIQPEKPQTARWKLEKMERISGLLAKDIARLEQERDAASARGDDTERKRMDMLLQRHRERIQKMRDEMQQLSRQAENEPPEQ